MPPGPAFTLLYLSRHMIYMFKKILIVEDVDSINIGLKTILENNMVADIRSTKYCDEAFLKVRKALYEEAPFELIITDLSFKIDHREAKLTSGEELIEAIRGEQPYVPIIVYSIEDRAYRIKSLFDKHAINAYVGKSRESGAELLDAIALCYKGEGFFISPHLSYILKDCSLLEIDDHDIELLKHLAEGYTQPEISDIFKIKGFASSSTSSIEKRINKLKIYFKAHNAIHLISIAKDLGVI